MNIKQKIAGFLLAIVALLGGGAALGSVNYANEYQYKVTRNHAGVAISDLTVIKNGAGTLGSVVITGTGSGYFVLYDATSTVTNADWATTTLATFPINATSSTYTFDLSFQKGLLIDTVGEVATSTITWR